MYKAFFGLSDNPFSIAPNPHYLFLSDRHREALAHLTYGLGDTGGFVLLTGEVGTGKTTVSRCLLNQLPENTDTAFILNPSLTEVELLATLCDELSIGYEKDPSLKQLTDLLSKYLLANHEKGRNTVLIIDEAQHLRPAVLEQLRLLTNLETDTKKLLQVILIGQPELQQLLKRQELRQLAQRITARYHLLPLTLEEVGLYVHHRLQVAGRHEPLFNQGAIKALHKYSGGIPRLINLLCERALMASYAKSTVPVDKKMVILASAEVLGEDIKQTNYLVPTGIAVAIGLFCVLGYLVLSNPDVAARDSTLTTVEIKPDVKVGAMAEPQRQRGEAKSDTNQRVLNEAIANSRNIDTAYASIFGLWGKVPYIGLSACQAAQQQGLSCFQQQGNWNSLIRLNFPAVVYLVDGQQQAFYGTVVSRSGDQLLLQLNEQQLWVDRDWFNRHFSGTFEILWQAPGGQPREIGQGSNLAQIQWLENSLAKIDNTAPRLVDRFDTQLEEQLKRFQRKHGLRADAIAGSQTLVQLNLYLSAQGPRLTQAKGHF
ncbi:AAA family ATPase [Shewanella sp. D64]|uniref:ExeA family protein n=1 Tax=unclassified Shewanella TaxID=196818 RepID=UPI0022BA367C|nr:MULTISPECIES: ExeA family protein [unclassified Shewanella]MEC4726667.1 AAA family ATPase [Shewanella sp. D64]MEC4738969.1 AAA family ATPase [Shewanella sp. E94]WBJ96882.1 AAA family ATPase [Shewanella sp. MTB7]